MNGDPQEVFQPAQEVSQVHATLSPGPLFPSPSLLLQPVISIFNQQISMVLTGLECLRFGKKSLVSCTFCTFSVMDVKARPAHVFATLAEAVARPAAVPQDHSSKLRQVARVASCEVRLQETHTHILLLSAKVKIVCDRTEFCCCCF